ncbi:MULTISPECIES: hypothetical protein, partial [unclassified Candidatus Cardinium]|uniref:hypothetical protein n=1 Tax=unclassified Candidatus Cardinium TaxID=2641185 RepID=UPI001FB4742C
MLYLMFRVSHLALLVVFLLPSCFKLKKCYQWGGLERRYNNSNKGSPNKSSIPHKIPQINSRVSSREPSNRSNQTYPYPNSCVLREQSKKRTREPDIESNSKRFKQARDYQFFNNRYDSKIGNNHAQNGPYKRPIEDIRETNAKRTKYDQEANYQVNNYRSDRSIATNNDNNTLRKSS